jgi:uncharacterized membrane protein YoaK (UPF0700 family)
MGIQLPRRVWIGAASLACVAGMVDVVGFVLGDVGGAWLISFLGYRTLVVPAALTGATGIAYALYRQRQLWLAKGL